MERTEILIRCYRCHRLLSTGEIERRYAVRVATEAGWKLRPVVLGIMRWFCKECSV